jgi:hypothetical protein
MTNSKLMRHSVMLAAAGAVAILAGSAISQPASAAIRCEGNFQITSQGPIATPYCEDNHLAIVAREHGMRVSASQIRHNVGIKEQVCRVVGHDIRVKNTCIPYMPESRGRYR